MELAPLFFAVIVGFSHCFEADHLVAVSSIVTRRDSTSAALKDGAFWGLGHTSTILLVALVYMLGKFVLSEAIFQYFEAGVGLMLIVLGIHRIIKLKSELHHPHLHEPAYGLAYGVGLMHGLAGSGGLLISVLTQIKEPSHAFLYLLLFGLGSVAGMMVAAGAFSLPFSSKLFQNRHLLRGLTLVSAALCVGLGVKIVLENVF